MKQWTVILPNTVYWGVERIYVVIQRQRNKHLARAGNLEITSRNFKIRNFVILPFVFFENVLEFSYHKKSLIN